MYIVVLIVHVLVSIMLILFILLQTGKGADLGAMLGGGGANTIFGATGATSFLSKLTTYSAVIFMITCLTLAYLSSQNPSTMDSVPPPTTPISDTDTPVDDLQKDDVEDTSTGAATSEEADGAKNADTPATGAVSFDSEKGKADKLKTDAVKENASGEKTDKAK